jgi:hypothetical protein
VITAQQAYDATDPNMTDTERVAMAERILASDAALTAYYDSRSQLEQIIAQAQGAGQVPTHADLNSGTAIATEPDGSPQIAQLAGDGPVVDGVAVSDDGKAIGSGAPVQEAPVPETVEEIQAEIDATNERVATLEAAKAAQAA